MLESAKIHFVAAGFGYPEVHFAEFHLGNQELSLQLAVHNVPPIIPTRVSVQFYPEALWVLQKVLKQPVRSKSYRCQPGTAGSKGQRVLLTKTKATALGSKGWWTRCLSRFRLGPSSSHPANSQRNPNVCRYDLPILERPKIPNCSPKPSHTTYQKT